MGLWACCQQRISCEYSDRKTACAGGGGAGTFGGVGRATAEGEAPQFKGSRAEKAEKFVGESSGSGAGGGDVSGMGRVGVAIDVVL